ncbi:MAG: hypothetical protein ABSA79_00355 [Candidatus Bathyarchaeia archaeon]|jgi:hypothetical protein
MSEVKCYYCGKAVGDEDLIMKNVSTGYFSSERKPFHKDCWKTYHGIRMKKDAIAYVAIALVAFLIFGGIVLSVIAGILGIIVSVSCIAVLIILGIAYYRIKE